MASKNNGPDWAYLIFKLMEVSLLAAAVMLGALLAENGVNDAIKQQAEKENDKKTAQPADSSGAAIKKSTEKKKQTVITKYALFVDNELIGTYDIKETTSYLGGRYTNTEYKGDDLKLRVYPGYAIIEKGSGKFMTTETYTGDIKVESKGRIVVDEDAQLKK